MYRILLLMPLIFALAILSSAAEMVDNAQKLANEGLHKDAYDLVRPWLLDAKNGDNPQFPQGSSIAITALQNLNRVAEIDELLESVAETQKESWKALTVIAGQYLGLPSFGYIIDNKFQRGNVRGARGQWVNTGERDRVRALQLGYKAIPFAMQENRKEAQMDTAMCFVSLAEVLQHGKTWQLQILTDITELPDYDTEWHYGGDSAAPVDVEGNPILYYVPESFETAKNDGERWRWALEQAALRFAIPENQKTVWRQQADFYRSQFGEQTLQDVDFFRNTEQEPEQTASILSLETLTDDETIAKLATGIKRFTLPEEFNYIKLYQKIGDLNALSRLADIAKNRRQYPKAAEYYATLLEKSDTEEQRNAAQHLLEQITGNWGRFEHAGSEVAGLHAELRYIFRNGKKVKLTAQKINVEQLIADVKEYLKSKPQGIDSWRIQIDQIAEQLFYTPYEESQRVRIREARQKYLGEVVKTWEVALEPAEKHFDRSTTITFSSDVAGAFLIRAEIEDGNAETAVVWLEDTAIVRKQLDGALLYFIADAETGKPIPGAKVDLFGYNLEYRQAQTRTWTFQESTHTTDNNGCVSFVPNTSNRDFNTLTTVTVPGKKGIAHLGFGSLWVNTQHDPEYNQVRTFVITDRPVYRPKDTVNIKAWVGTAKYDMPNTNEWAGKAIKYEIHDPRGEKMVEKEIVLDEYGGMTTELELSKDATLGVYNLQFHRINSNNGWLGHGNFRVEEYKKPEYEVTIDAPKEPVALGETITAKINANYYFGSPVAEATVKYTVMRQTADTDWYPILPWDWFYGNGYGWFAYDSDWLPGWARWGICRPVPPWFPSYSGPPEIVAEAETQIRPDGTVDVVIDTAIAKEMFPNDSQRYTITAEVIDNSRRTIVGTGTVLVAKEPFKVYSWVNRGWYTPGQKVSASFQTRRLDGKPVSGEAAVKVFRLTYERESATVSPDVKISETEVHSAMVTFDAHGKANLDLNASEPGQYRISCILDGQEGGYVFNVYANNLAGTPATAAGAGVPAKSSWKYNALELIPERSEYAPGENVTLRINTDRENSTVLLFIKPANGIAAGRPQVLRLTGKSTEVSIPVVQKDMPNFFVEALTVSGGEIVSEVREIVVPPQQKVLNVEVRPNSDTYKPGGKATADLIVTDLAGNPVVGQIALTIYDKSVEYISGGSNVGDIKEFFWKWRRNHQPQTTSNLNRWWQSFSDPGKPGMEMLGIFGFESPENFARNGVAKQMRGGGMGGMGGARISLGLSLSRGEPMDLAMPMAAAPMDMASAEMEPMDAVSLDDAGEMGALVEPTIRSNFADTALWIGALETDSEGVAKIELDMPESLTTWKINVWTMALGTRVGHGSTEVITRKDMILRMQTPRFLIEKDKVVLSANVHNYLANEKEVVVSLNMSRKCSEAEPAGSAEDTEVPLRFTSGSLGQTQTVKIPANGEARIDWLVEAKTAGDAKIVMKALTDEESDAVERTLPVYVHGMPKQDSFSAFIAQAESSTSFEIRVPEERKPEQTKLTVQFSPSLASSMIEALPYLVDYPYGCVEQTLNKFLPTVIVRKIIGDGWDISPRDPSVAQRNLGVSPVFDREQIDEMVQDGVTRLTNMPNSDGGWGWFSGSGERSSAYWTALVVHGLQLARECDVDVPDDVINRGLNWLKRYQDSQIVLLKNAAIPDKEEKKLPWKAQADEVDAFVFMVLAQNFCGIAIDSPMADMLEFLQRDRGKLSLYAVAKVGIAESYLPGKRDLTPYVKILEQYLVQDDANQTAYLNLNNFAGWRWWVWYGSEFETQAYYLKLLMRTDPKSPIAPRLVKYLLNNRKHATYWNSTRDTAIVIEAFAEYLKTTGEGKPNVTVEVLVDGEVKKTVEFTPENFLLADNALILEGNEVATGTHKVELRTKGDSPVYITAYLENFTLEDSIEKAGLEVAVERRIYRLIRDESATVAASGSRGQVVDMKVEKYKREPATVSPFALQSGDLIEVELIIESKNDYENLLIEDWKAAGCEPVDLRSGYNGNELGAYVEFRDERVVFFVNRLARGKHSVTYRLRAETPGEFSALPTRIEAMYAPELKGNSDEDKVNVKDGTTVLSSCSTKRIE